MVLRELLLEKLFNNISDVKYLKILDITNKHLNHLPENPSETHFKITAVSNEFHGLSQILRHRTIYKLLNFELTHKIHALSLALYTVNEHQDEKRHINNQSRARFKKV